MYERKAIVYIEIVLQHGESEYNVLGKIGGDAVLSARGERYAQAVSTKFNAMRIPDFRVLTSRLRRTIATARGIEAPQEHIAALNELHAGVCEGLSYEEMQEHYPQVIILGEIRLTAILNLTCEIRAQSSFKARKKKNIKYRSLREEEKR